MSGPTEQWARAVYGFLSRHDLAGMLQQHVESAEGLFEEMDLRRLFGRLFRSNNIISPEKSERQILRVARLESK